MQDNIEKISRVKDYLRRKNIDPLNKHEELPVGLVNRELVPIRGSVHISSGRVISRKNIERLFRKVKFVQ